MIRPGCLVILLALFFGGCLPAPKNEDRIYTLHDNFEERIALMEEMQTQRMAANLYHHFDSLALQGKVSLSFLDSLTLFRKACDHAQGRMFTLRSDCIQQCEGIPAYEADTIRTVLLTHLNERVNISPDTLSAMNHLLIQLEYLGNGLPHKKGRAQSKAHPGDGYDAEHGTVAFWGHEAFAGVSLKEALQSLRLLQMYVMRFELEVLLSVRAGIENAYWAQ
jgi:hypothetical protein